MNPALANKTILLVEDEQDIRTLLEFSLKKLQANVVTVATGEEGLWYLDRGKPDLVLLDWMLPGVDGIELCQIMRSKQGFQNIPIIMLTAKGEEEDIVRGLEAGATDYVTKPYSTKVLAARIQAALMNRDRVEEAVRTSSTSTSHSTANTSIVAPSVSGPLTLYEDRYEIYLNGIPLELTISEYKVLFLLASKPGRVYTRYQIMESLKKDMKGLSGAYGLGSLEGEEEISSSSRSVDVVIVGLRKKLKGAGKLISTVRGVGYRFLPEYEE